MVILLTFISLSCFYAVLRLVREVRLHGNYKL